MRMVLNTYIALCILKTGCTVLNGINFIFSKGRSYFFSAKVALLFYFTKLMKYFIKVRLETMSSIDTQHYPIYVYLEISH